jgi:uncharacterized protein
MNDAYNIFVDSDIFIALTVANDSNHQKAVALLTRLLETPAKFFTSNYVFSESITVISQRSSHAAAVAYIRRMQAQDSPFQIQQADEALDEQALQIFMQQTSKNTSYVDCTNIAFVQRLHADAIFSFDGDYRKNRLRLASELIQKEQAA